MQDTFHRGKVHANEVTRKETSLRGEEEPSSFEKHGAIEFSSLLGAITAKNTKRQISRSLSSWLPAQPPQGDCGNLSSKLADSFTHLCKIPCCRRQHNLCEQNILDAATSGQLSLTL